MFGVVGPREPLTWSRALAALVEAGGGPTELVWVDEAFLQDPCEGGGRRTAAVGYRLPGLHISMRARWSLRGFTIDRSAKRSPTPSPGIVDVAR